MVRPGISRIFDPQSPAVNLNFHVFNTVCVIYFRQGIRLIAGSSVPE
jgi:hypothetical protein